MNRAQLQAFSETALLEGRPVEAAASATLLHALATEDVATAIEHLTEQVGNISPALIDLANKEI